MITANFDVIATLHEDDLEEFLKKLNLECDFDVFDVEDIVEKEILSNYSLGDLGINGIKVLTSDRKEMDFFDWFEKHLRETIAVGD